jgi:hypothetical protein
MNDIPVSPATPDQIQAAVQRAEAPTATETPPSLFMGDGGAVTSSVTPFIPTARPVGETPTAAVQAAIQRAEALPVVTPVPVAPARPRVTAQPVVAPLSTVQRTADPMPEPVNQPAPERPDVFQAMVAAGMVAPPPGGMTVQRTPDATEAIRRAESLPPSSKPDLAQALGLISRASDANAQVQRAPDELSMPPVVVGGVPVEPTVQRAIEFSEVEDEVSEKARGQAPNIDLDKLADDVYRSLEKRLRTAADRRPK